MGWTKRELVNAAFSEIGLAEYAFDVQPEQLQDAVRRLNSMIGVWDGRGIRLGWPLPSDPSGGDLDDDSNLPSWAVEAVYLNLAVRIAPGYGKAVAMETKASAMSAFNAVLLNLRPIPQMRPDVMSIPSGAGFRERRRITLHEQPDPINTGSDGELSL